MRHDEMVCVCGEVLVTEEQSDRGQPETGHLARQYQEHMLRSDHQPSPGQWYEANKRIEAAKEAAKSARSTEK